MESRFTSSHFIDHLVHPRSGTRFPAFVGAREVVEIFPDLQIVVNGEKIREIADVLLGALRLGGTSTPSIIDVPGRGRKEAAHMRMVVVLPAPLGPIRP